MTYGLNGKILHIDLTASKLTVEKPPESFFRKYMGGSALNTYYLLKEMPVGTDPLGPDNVFAVSVSVVTGSPITGLSRVTTTAKSPLTGAIGDAQAGGFFPAEMKFSGFEAFIFKGRSPKPVYLWVNDGTFELRDASHLWGKDMGEVEDAIREELGDDRIEIAQTGIAGENGVLFSAVINMCNRANGRTGMGAVMASKNLKAIAVRGKEGRKNLTYADKEHFTELARIGTKKVVAGQMDGLGKMGTAGFVNIASGIGQLPTNNFESGFFDKAQDIDGVLMYETMLKGALEGKQDSQGRDTCFGCAVRCKRVVDVKKGKFTSDPRYGGPEYETLAMLGSDCGVTDLAAVVKANELCNKYGIDTISCGGTIAWAMECFENGKLTIEDTGGMEIKRGSAEVLVNLIEMIAHREGFGEILAQGSHKASEIIGRGTDEYLVTAHRQEFPAHLPRTKASLGVIYAVNPFGADHQSSAHDPVYEVFDPEKGAEVPPALKMLNLTTPTPPGSMGKEKMEFARVTQDFVSFLDSICACQFIYGAGTGLYDPNELVDIIKSITGWDLTLKEILEVGERRVNMMRAFNAREGFDREQDALPAKMFKPLVGGVSDGAVLKKHDFESALDEYFAQRGWDVSDGNPKQEKLEELGLSWIAA